MHTDLWLSGSGSSSGYGSGSGSGSGTVCGYTSMSTTVAPTQYGESCSNTKPCSHASTFCNFDMGANGGLCEPCTFNSIGLMDCNSIGLITAEGVADCQARCTRISSSTATTTASLCLNPSAFMPDAVGALIGPRAKADGGSAAMVPLSPVVVAA